MPPLWSSKQKEAADRSVTSRNQVDRSATKWCPAKTTSMLLRSSAFSVTEWRSSQRRRADSRHHDIEGTNRPRRRIYMYNTSSSDQCLLGVQHRQHARAPMWVVTFCSRPDVGSRVNDALSVSQILAHNFENAMPTNGYTYHMPLFFTGPRVQIPSSPYQQGLGLVRG